MKNQNCNFLGIINPVSKSLLLFLLVVTPEPVLGSGLSDLLIQRNLGLAHLEQNQNDQALEAFKEVAELAPDEPLGYANSGLVYLRMQQLGDAEAWLKKAIVQGPGNAQVRSLLAEVYLWQHREEDFVREIREAIRLDPGDDYSRYKFATYNLRSRRTPESLGDAEDQLRGLFTRLPANIVVRLKLGEILLRRKNVPEARKVYEGIRKDLWGIPDAAVPYLEKGLEVMSQGKPDEALLQMIVFENVQKGGFRYRSAISELVQGATGLPLERFSAQLEARLGEYHESPIPIAFRDATQAVGLGQDARGFALGDLDDDGALDVYVCRRAGGGPGNVLLVNERGKFVDVTDQRGLGFRGDFESASMADYDNDGDSDLLVWSPQGQGVFARNDNGMFVDISGDGILSSRLLGNNRKSLFVDYDHDGDLDLILIKAVPDEGRFVVLLRNNGDETFLDVGKKAGLEGTFDATDVAFGDFDEDGDTDLMFVGKEGVSTYTNLRQGRLSRISVGFESISESGKEPGSPPLLDTADYDNDGFLDVFTGVSGSSQIYRNQGDGIYRKSEALIPGSPVADARFLDYDNDGWVDLVASGLSNGLHLFRNQGDGFGIVPGILPPGLQSNQRPSPMDSDADGDLDLLITHGDKIRLLRNDGGNANGWLTVKLVGLKVGSSKNNIAGIGVKMELKSGKLYQMKVVAGPVTHFGLGGRTRAEVLRVVWTNGVPQNRIAPEINTRIIEKQSLKGSCPFLYAWDGKRYRFVTDLLWRSPLGMLMDDGRHAFSDSGKDYVKIRGDQLREKDGKLTLRVTEELWETIYLDEAKLLVVDHPEEADIYVDERFVPPPFPSFRLHTVQNPRLPVSAIDDQGQDILDSLRVRDGRFVDGLVPTPYQGIVQPHSLTLDLGDFPDGARVVLFLNGWIFPTDTSLNFALSQRGDGLRGQPPTLEVPDRNGVWQPVIPFAGFPNGKRKTCILDLSGKFLCGDHRVRISTNMQIYWDHVFFSVDEPETRTMITSLKPSVANLRYRGFSRLFRESENGPHLFDYDVVKRGSTWRDLEGMYTQYGDVTPLLLSADDQYVVMNAGDEVALVFDGVPPPPDGWSRDFVFYSDGWVKDGDINTAHSQSVDPMPYHGMSSYPFGQGDAYPDDEGHRYYLETYQTRVVGNQGFRDQVKVRGEEKMENEK